MARRAPKLRSTETYTETNFLRLLTRPATRPGLCRVVLEHLSHRGTSDDGGPASHCATIIDGEEMSRADALFIAEQYAAQNDIPVIYECTGNPATPRY